MQYTPIEKKFVLAAISHLWNSTKGGENKDLAEIHADAYGRVEAGHDSANDYVKVLVTESIRAIDRVLGNPIISEEVRVRAQTTKDVFVGIKEKLK